MWRVPIEFATSTPTPVTPSAPSRDPQPDKPSPHALFEKAWPVLALILAIVSVQSSASLAKTLFSQMAPQGVTCLRLLISALMLLAFFRPWRQPIAASAWRPIIAYGVALACMSTAFYLAIQRIPLGIAVALEFLGPLALVFYGMRTRLDALWACLAMMGLVLLTPIHALSSDLDPLGIAWALVAGVSWALYIVYGRRAGLVCGPGVSAIGTAVAAVCVLPVGLATSGMALFSLDILPTALVIGLFASAVPYSLEMVSMTRMPQKTFGILTSLEPAFAALSGLVFLGEALSTLQWGALIAISLASLGSTVTRQRA